MLILVIMLLIGVFAAAWGFLMCFLPLQWDKLTAAISFAGRWTEPSSKHVHPLIRFGNRVSGLAIMAVGCWFGYVAGSEIYLVLSGRAPSHIKNPVHGTLSNSPALGVTALSFFVIVAGILMAMFPAKAIGVYEGIWPLRRSVTPSAAPKVILVVRLSGVFFAFIAFMFLIQ